MFVMERREVSIRVCPATFNASSSALSLRRRADWRSSWHPTSQFLMSAPCALAAHPVSIRARARPSLPARILSCHVP